MGINPSADRRRAADNEYALVGGVDIWPYIEAIDLHFTETDDDTATTTQWTLRLKPTREAHEAVKRHCNGKQPQR